MFKKTKQLTTWLNKRDWFGTENIDRVIEKFEKEINDARVDATKKIINELRDYRREAVNATTDLSLTKRQRQMCQTEVTRITTEITRLEASL
jgi:uncharacterized protein (DUF3084 family)